ncbi:adenosine deaminase [Cohnella faecalis]|uniref:adenosine deaminase n=1 Tax=Cohnella faecalis TaxID=2315694 RepID=A0A398CC95_9BACL|nr:adenosine deaminase [Cohnella faecalis]RIE00786.1 adenosine deaminase [Cohnella faecalis]
MVRDDSLRFLPKVDLHLHLDGCVSPDTLAELAAQENVPLPAKDRAGLLPYMQVKDDCVSLKDYLTKFDFVLPLLQTGEALERVAYETVEQAARQRTMYLEVRFAPQLHRLRGMSAEETIGHVIGGLRRGEKDFGVKSRVIAICMRHHPERLNLEVIEAASAYLGKGLGAVDLAGDEASFPAHRFRSVFTLANRKSIPVTIHAGEAAGPANIREAVNRLGAARIGHGVRLREDPDLRSAIRNSRIPLELCPTSNLQTKAVSRWDDYPIRDYFEDGILVTVNTDNPTVSGTDMTTEYRILRERFGFTLRELGQLTLNGVEAAFLEPNEKKLLKKEIEQALPL